jgi:hypothetical protein
LDEAAKAERTFLGAHRCRRTSPCRRARSFEPLRDRNPTFAVGRGNREGFFAAVQELRTLRDVAFPAGTWAMKRLHAVVVAKLAA